MWTLLKSGGILMLPLLCCGIAATFIIIERFLYFSAIKKSDEQLKKNLSDALLSRDFSAAEAACVTAGTPFARVIKKAVEFRKLSEKDLKEIVEAEIELAIPLYEHSLTLLATIASVSTLLGLLGTVTGNIKAFGVLGAGGSVGNPAVLANAIAEALVTTATGLFVAIPATIFNNFFTRKVNKEIILLESSVTEIVLKITGRIY